MIFKARPYQLLVINRIVTDCAVAIWIDMGMGKTVATLTAFNELKYDRLAVGCMLVIAPKRVAQSTWVDEIKQWDHLKHLTSSIILGTEQQRKQALKVKADIYIINRENVAWLVGQRQANWPFKMVVIDESSSFKAADSVRFKALRIVRPQIERMVCLTGTPASNGLMDLWSQMYLLDQGQRLGKFVTNYRDRFFINANHQWWPKEGSTEKIYGLIEDICISMKSEDYLDLPKVVENTTSVVLTEAQMARYKVFERDRVLEMKDVNNITAVNAAVLTNKLLQYANGAIYDEDRIVHEVHNAKIEAIEEAVEALNGQTVMIAYSYKHDLERLKKALKSHGPRTLDTPQDIKDWNEGKIRVLLIHPASAGHGLNLQFGGHHIIWFGLTWSLELYQQLCKRLDRPGQKFPVVITRLVVKGTMDERVIPTIKGKAERQDALLEAVKVLINKYR